MGRKKQTTLNLTDGNTTFYQKGTEPVKNLPQRFEASIQGDGFHVNIQFRKHLTNEKQRKADIIISWDEDIKDWR